MYIIITRYEHSYTGKWYGLLIPGRRITAKSCKGEEGQKVALMFL